MKIAIIQSGNSGFFPRFYKSTWQGNNKFVRSIGIIAAGWYLNSFVGDITGCKFYHIAFFLLIGCCLSRRWLNYTDIDIKRIMQK